MFSVYGPQIFRLEIYRFAIYRFLIYRFAKCRLQNPPKCRLERYIILPLHRFEIYKLSLLMPRLGLQHAWKWLKSTISITARKQPIATL